MANSADPDTIVYITETGRKYHREGCLWIKSRSVVAVSLSGLAETHEPCQSCMPDPPIAHGTDSVLADPEADSDDLFEQADNEATEASDYSWSRTGERFILPAPPPREDDGAPFGDFRVERNALGAWEVAFVPGSRGESDSDQAAQLPEPPVGQHGSASRDTVPSVRPSRQGRHSSPVPGASQTTSGASQRDPEPRPRKPNTTISSSDTLDPKWASPLARFMMIVALLGFVGGREWLQSRRESVKQPPTTLGRPIPPSEASLLQAAEDGDVATVRACLESGVDINCRRSNSEWTPLHLAAMNGNAEVARLLLDHGAEVDAREYQRKTPLHRAAQNGSVAIIDMLLNHGADIDARDNIGFTPREEAEAHRYWGAASALRQWKRSRGRGSQLVPPPAPRVTQKTAPRLRYTCSSCSGSGRTICPTCRGTGVCSACNGKKGKREFGFWEACWGCNGTGACGDCRAGRVTCSRCGGRGTTAAR